MKSIDKNIAIIFVEILYFDFIGCPFLHYVDQINIGADVLSKVCLLLLVLHWRTLHFVRFNVLNIQALIGKIKQRKRTSLFAYIVA